MPKLTDRETATVSDEALVSMVFGDECRLCADPDPCSCGLSGRDANGNVLHCACTCGRCTFDGPLPDDGPCWQAANWHA